jgi:hypothetical protein
MQVKNCENCGKFNLKLAKCMAKSTCLHFDLWEPVIVQSKTMIPEKKLNPMSDTVSLKFDKEKLRWDLIPMDVVEKIVEIYTFGSKKYGDNTWQGIDQDRYYAALMRHLVEWRKGNSLDDESGKLHLSHAAWNAIAILWHELQKQGVIKKKSCKSCIHYKENEYGCMKLSDHDIHGCINNNYKHWEESNVEKI